MTALSTILVRTVKEGAYGVWPGLLEGWGLFGTREKIPVSVFFL